MDWLISLLSPSGSPLPPTVNAVFVIVVIFGLTFLFFEFILRGFKYYWETMRPMINQEKKQIEELAIEKSKKTLTNFPQSGEFPPDSHLFNMVSNINDRITEMVDNYSGKYVHKNEITSLKKEIENLKNEIKDVYTKLEDARENLSNLKGHLGKDR